MGADRVYGKDEVAQRLGQSLQHWRSEDGCIARSFRCEGWKGALMVVNAIGHLAEAAWHHPDLAVSYDAVQVRLSTHSAGGVTDKDFALAEKIEQVIGWQPAREGGPLEGTPNDPRHRYIRYDT